MIFAALFGAAALLPLQVHAEAGSGKAGPPDFSGNWTPARNQHPVNESMVAELPANTVMLDDASVAEFPMNEYGGLKIKPEAAAKAAEWRPADAMTLSNVCAVPSVIYSMQGPFPFVIYQLPQVIIMKMQYFDQVRLIWMDGREHQPASTPHTKLGDSIGHWEGDELVIDTTNIAPSTLTNNGLDHTDDVHFVERYRLSADGQHFEGTQWFSDANVLDNNGARYMKFDKRPSDSVMYPYECDPSFAEDYKHVEQGAVGDDGEFEVLDDEGKP